MNTVVVVNMSTYIDPVCGKSVDPGKTGFKTVYKGRVYYFCCRHCLSEFEKNPEYYMRRLGQ